MIKSDFDDLADSAYLRLSDLVEKHQIICVSKATLWRMVKRGDFPSPVKLSQGITAWQVKDIRTWMELVRRRSKSHSPTKGAVK